MSDKFLSESIRPWEFSGLHTALSHNRSLVYTAILESAILREDAKQSAVCPLRHFTESF